MSGSNDQTLSGVTETLLMPLYIRALESQRSDALLKDEKAVALVRQMDYDSSRILAKVDEEVRVAVLLRNRQIDQHAQDFLKRNPDAVVVHIGCGLDARFERVDNGRVEWYDLDLPEVIELRQKLIGGEGGRYHFLAGSVLDSAWLDTVSLHRQRPFLFLAEGVLIYFEEAQVKSLVLTLKEHFPAAELVFDAFSPFFVWANNRRVRRTKVGARCQWALKRGIELESWGMAFACWMNGSPSPSRSRALAARNGCDLFHCWSKPRAFSTIDLEGGQMRWRQKMSAPNPAPSSPHPLPRRSSRYSFKWMNSNSPTGRSNPARMSMSLMGVASPRASEPNTRTLYAPCRTTVFYVSPKWRRSIFPSRWMRPGNIGCKMT
jgi:O-methyltransferase involved in polyketide biosynthesis